MAATGEMLEVALRHRPHAVCIVPEKRQEVTTEGGLDVVGAQAHLEAYVGRLSQAGCRVSMFIDPEGDQLAAAKAVGAPVVELHTGAYCDAEGAERERELERLCDGAAICQELGLECHAGHGLSFDNVLEVAAIPNVVELNIGHFLVGEAIFGGLDSSIRRMRALMDQARAELSA
jgi:pyridoxine 5-phosphate synthase